MSVQVLHETKKIGNEFPIGVDLQQTHQDVLPPIPISTKLEDDDVKQQIMDLYPDLFSGVGTIRNAMVHLDVKPGAVPVICSPCSVPHAVQPKLKEELDRMLKLGVIRKLDINKASDWVHTLVIVIKPYWISNMPVPSNKTELQSLYWNVQLSIFLCTPSN